MSVPDRLHAAGKPSIRVVLLGGLATDTGFREVQVEAETWVDALRRLRTRFKALELALDENGKPKPGYLVFVDGVDYRLARPGPAREVVILPVNHGGSPGKGVDVLSISWEDVERLSADIGKRIQSDNIPIDVIVGVMRGGVIPARIIGDVIGVDELDVVEVKFYTGIERRMGRPYVKRAPSADLHGRNVLVVDDISDTGLTLQVVVNLISLYGPRRIVTATLYAKPWTRFVPDYYAAMTDKWVIFPWEKWESLRELEKQ